MEFSLRVISNRMLILVCFLMFFLPTYANQPDKIVPYKNKEANDSFSNSVQEYTKINPIVITSDEEFTDEVWSGNGSLTDPYLLEYIEIIYSSGYESCVFISNTRYYFKIQDCRFISNDYRSGPGIIFKNVSHATIDMCGFERDYYSVKLENCSQVNITRNTVYVCDSAFILSQSTTRCLLSNNEISECYNSLTYKPNSEWNYGDLFRDFAVCIEDASLCTIMKNRIRYSEGGIGITGVNNTLLENEIGANMKIGILLAAQSRNNSIYSNVFSSNGELNAHDDGSENLWDDTISHGNTWSDYDGQGSYIVPGEAVSIDRFPSFLSNDTLGPMILWNPQMGLIADGAGPLGEYTYEITVRDPSGIDTVQLWRFQNKTWVWYAMNHTPIEENADRFEYTFAGICSIGGEYYYWANDTAGNVHKTRIDSFSIGGPCVSVGTLFFILSFASIIVIFTILLIQRFWKHRV